MHFADNQHQSVEFPGMSPTKRDTLSYEENKTLNKCSTKNDVMVVPDIDFPSHAGPLLQQMKKQEKDR
ncbi:hypothetical protein [Staphylococcus pseudintermedius]|uniref:hypothetical protein n=1 Tax=Staphylococcus pseudintermedius TaxID=283734 RepID=UPI002161BBBD|nr:hypothetical protein [Staphylococcus pseudintermedius]